MPKWPEKWRINICKFCRRDFLMKISAMTRGRGKFCSKNCFNEWSKINRIGEKSAHWKGTSITYYGLHAWIRKILGNPQHCEDCQRIKPPKGKGKTRSYFQWANVSGNYKRDPTDWKRLCYLCHKKFDKNKKILTN